LFLLLDYEIMASQGWGMALGKIKTEAGKKNGNGCWMRRADAKRIANKARRINDKKESNGKRNKSDWIRSRNGNEKYGSRNSNGMDRKSKSLSSKVGQ